MLRRSWGIFLCNDLEMVVCLLQFFGKKLADAADVDIWGCFSALGSAEENINMKEKKL